MRFGRTPADHVRESGLTGSPEIPDPPSERPQDWRARWQLVRSAIRGTMSALPRVLSLVWGTSPPLTIGLGAATVLAGVTPAATALVSKYLINSVVQAIALHNSPHPNALVAFPI